MTRVITALGSIALGPIAIYIIQMIFYNVTHVLSKCNIILDLMQKQGGIPPCIC